jgi:hypothetical protein
LNLNIFKPKRKETVDDILKNNDCNSLLKKAEAEYGKDMTGLIIIIEKDKQTFWYCAGMEPAQAILSLDQLHHRVQHEGLPNYD